MMGSCLSLEVLGGLCQQEQRCRHMPHHGRRPVSSGRWGGWWLLPRHGDRHIQQVQCRMECLWAMEHSRMLRVAGRQILGFLAEAWWACRRMQFLGLGLGHFQQFHLGHHLTQWRSQHELLKTVDFLGLAAGWDSLDLARMELMGQ